MTGGPRFYEIRLTNTDPVDSIHVVDHPSSRLAPAPIHTVTGVFN